MAKCKRCNITILDNTNICPLCKCVLEGHQYSGKGDQYPRVHLKQRAMQKISNMILVVVLVSSMILALLNSELYVDKWWCIIPIVSMVYVYLIFYLAFVSKEGYRLKIFQSVVITLALILTIDIATGFNRWSLNYVMPASVIIIDIISLILMFINLKEWQSYLMIQIVAIAFGMLPLTLWFAGMITRPLLTFIAVGIAVIMFLGTLIVGDYRARGELKRRFHIR